MAISFGYLCRLQNQAMNHSELLSVAEVSTWNMSLDLVEITLDFWRGSSWNSVLKS